MIEGLATDPMGVTMHQHYLLRLLRGSGTGGGAIIAGVATNPIVRTLGVTMHKH